MKTEVKFRELPEKVQGFLKRVFGAWLDTSDHVITFDWLHNLPEWSEATDEERLAYAEWRYPVGVIFRSIMSGTECKSDGIITDDDYEEKAYIFTGNNAIYNYRINKWSEIISEPETELDTNYCEEMCDDCSQECVKNILFQAAKSQDKEQSIKEASPEAQQNFVKANPGMQHVEEPKAGDMVEGSNGNGWEPLTRFTGGKTANGDFICEDLERMRIRSERDIIKFYEAIRLPQKSEVESKVKELIKNVSVKDDDMQSVVLKHDIPILVEAAIKWGQANPDKI